MLSAIGETPKNQPGIKQHGHLHRIVEGLFEYSFVAFGERDPIVRDPKFTSQCQEKLKEFKHTLPQNWSKRW
jgi:hypothetical protein